MSEFVLHVQLGHHTGFPTLKALVGRWFWREKMLGLGGGW